VNTPDEAAAAAIEVSAQLARDRRAMARLDVYRRRLTTNVPNGWPILSPQQHSAALRIHAAALAAHRRRRDGLRIEGVDLWLLARLLEVAVDLAQATWTEPPGLELQPDLLGGPVRLVDGTVLPDPVKLASLVNSHEWGARLAALYTPRL
jgi:hypothetical protein